MSALRWAVTQPWRGLFGVLVCMWITIGITSAFSLEKFIGLFTVWANSLVPIQVVIGLVWGCRYPPVEKFDQPWRGFALAGFMFLIGSMAALYVVKFIGGGSANPVSNNFSICVVLLTFFAVIAFSCWPFENISLASKGFLTLLLVYLVAPVVMLVFWDFGAIAATIGSPAGFWPSGWCSWESALSFFFVMFAYLWMLFVLEKWPLTKSPALSNLRQPWAGILLLVICFVLALISFAIGVWVLGLKPLKLMLAFMCFVAGALTVTIVLQGWPGRRWNQPVRGLVNLLVSFVPAFAIFYLYNGFAGYHFGREVMVTYPANCMVLGNMMLGITFPAYVAYSLFLDFWPLPPTSSAGSGEGQR